MAQTIWMNRNDLTDMLVNEASLPVLGEGQIRLRIDSFSVTANNISYAVMGDGFGYWNFFPAEEGYGVVPVWGYATIEESRHTQFEVGERLYGFFPMGTHLDVQPGNISAGGFVDAMPHRSAMSVIYNQYSRLAADPEHESGRENERMIFAPLFKTGYLIENMFRNHDWFGANAILMTSASSKTSMALASCVMQSSPGINRVGLTSRRNVDFTKNTGLYNNVIAYEDLADLPKSQYVSVDFAGNPELLKSIHAALDDQLKYSSLVGLTHVADRGGDATEITGPQPIVFFAPDHGTAAIKEMGAKAFIDAVAKNWSEFLGVVGGSIKMDERSGIDTAMAAFQSTYANNGDPAQGIIIRP